MQSKKRAKSIKFGKKPQAHKEKPVELEDSHEPKKHSRTSTEGKNPSPPDTKQEKPQESIEVTVEAVTEELEITPPTSENNNTDSPSNQEESSTSKPDMNYSEEPSFIPQQNPATQESDQTEEISPSDTESDLEKPDDTPASSLENDTYFENKEVKRNMLGFFMLVAVVSFVIGLISMAALTSFLPKIDLLAGTSMLLNTPSHTPTPNPTSAPTPTPKEVDLAEYSITILNGSGVTGAASELKDSLTSAGFKVDTVGNADTSDYTDTVVYAKKGVNKEYLTKLNDELEKMYTVSSESQSPTTASDEADVVITIGTNSASDLNP